MADINYIREVISLIKEMEVPFYIHAGFGLHLYGLDSELDDCDIRVYHEDISKVFHYLQERLQCNVTVRGAMQYEKGIYKNDCIKLNNGLEFDICTHMEVICDLGRFEFPFNKDTFNDTTRITYKNLQLPVASLESMLLYYLVLRRGKADGKDDKTRIRDISSDSRFIRKKFELMVAKLPQAEQIFKLYNETIN